MDSTIWIIYLALLVVTIAGIWQVFVKAGEAGWQSIIPIWNTIVLLRIIGRPVWWIILFLIPLVGFVAWILVANDLSKSFGRGAGTTIGRIFLAPIFFIILGFGDATYRGPSAGDRGTAPAV